MKGYDIKELEKYIRDRRKGLINPVMEQRIQEDNFLSYLAAGIEAHLDEYPDQVLDHFLKNKKEQLWQSIEQSINPKTTSTAIQTLQPSSLHRFFTRSLQFLKGEVDIHSYHYLMGFNCCCLLVLISMIIWLNCWGGDLSSANEVIRINGFKDF